MVIKHVPILSVVVAPATEPITLVEAKLYLRVDTVDEDTLINRLIIAARQSAEKFMRRSLITQQWKLSYDNYAPTELTLPRGPIQSIISVKFIKKDASETTLTSAQYFLTAEKQRLVFEITPLSHIIEIIYTAGFGVASAVPEDIKQGMLIHIAQLYENRPIKTEIENGSKSLYFAYRELKI